MSDKENPITIHDSDSESDSENLTEHASGRDSEPMEGLNSIIEGPVPSLPLLSTECTENQSEELVLLEGYQRTLPSGSNIRQEGLAVGRLLSQSTQSQVRSGENGIQGSVSHPPSIKINVIQLGPVSKLQMLDTQLTDNQNQSEEFVSLHVESDQHASGSNLRPEGSDLAPSVHSLERQSHEQNTPLKTDCTKNQKDSVILEGEQSNQGLAMGLVIPSENCILLSCTKASHLENQTESECQATRRNPEPAAGQNNVTQGPVLNPPGIPMFDTVSQGRSDLKCTERPTHGRDVESVNWSTLNTTRADFETRLLSQSLQSQGLKGAGSLLKEIKKQNPIRECLENQTNYTAGSVMLEGEQETSGSGQERENGIQGSVSVSHPPSIKINVIRSPVSNLQVLDTQFADNQNHSEEFVSLHVESDQHASGSNLRPEGSDLAPSVHSLERQSHEQNTPLKTDCTKNQKDSVILEGEQSNQGLAMGLVIPSENCILLSCTKASHLENQTESECQATRRNPEPAAGQNNVTQGPVLNPPGIPMFDTVSQGRSDLKCTERPTHGRDVESVNWSTLNTTRADFETRLLSQSLQSQGLKGAGSLLKEMKKQNQIQECLENQTNCTAGSVMLEGEQETSRSGQERENGNQGSVSHPPSIKINVSQLGSVSNLQVLDTQFSDNQNQSE